MIDPQIHRDFKYNFVVNVIEAMFFGFVIGFASSVTIVPLFVETLTDNTAIIGMVASIQAVGWQLPQVLMSSRVARLSRYKPMVLLISLHERWPYLVLAAVVLLMPTLGKEFVLWATVFLLAWQAFGGGFTGTVWQSYLGKIIPLRHRGMFFGVQTAGVNLLAAITGVMAGHILISLDYPYNYALCFFLAGVGAFLSLAVLSLAREPESEVKPSVNQAFSWQIFRDILRSDGEFRLYVIARVFVQSSISTVAFFTLYGTRHFAMDESMAGQLFAILTITGLFSTPLLGAWGDRWRHRYVFAVTTLLMGGASLMMLLAPDVSWLYFVFVLTGIGGAAAWLMPLLITLQFGTDETRPYYIGLANTLVAPATLIVPMISGYLVDAVGFDAAFLLSIASAVIAALLFIITVPEAANK